MSYLHRTTSTGNLKPKATDRSSLTEKLRQWFIRLMLFSLPIVIWVTVREVRSDQFMQYEKHIESQSGVLTQSKAATTENNYKDYSGVIHVHTALGGHSTGRFEELIEAAHTNSLDFVIMTEHQSTLFNPLKYTLDGKIGNTLFIAGTEQHVPRVGRVLIVGGDNDSELNTGTTTHTLDSARKTGSLIFMAYPDRFSGKSHWVNGIEVMSLHSGMREANPWQLLLDMLFIRKDYRSLIIAKHLSRPDRNLSYFDAMAKKSPLTLFPGSDAHSNIGFHLLGDSAGHTVADFKLDAYSTVLAVSQLHVLMKPDQPLDKKSVLNALKQGHAYIGTDIIGDPTGFKFYTGTDNSRKIMGDTIALAPQEAISLHVEVPIASDIAILHDGKMVQKSHGVTRTTLRTTEAGNYRVEVYRSDIGPAFTNTPWILSNPIYVDEQHQSTSAVAAR